MLLGSWVINHAQSPLASSGCEQSAGGSRISVTWVRRMDVCPGWGPTAGSRRVGDHWPLWEEAILTDSRTGIIQPIKRPAALKARQNKLQHGDSAKSLSSWWKVFLWLACPYDNSKGPFCIFADIYENEWACVMCQNVLLAYREKDNTRRWRFVKYSH